MKVSNQQNRRRDQVIIPPISFDRPKTPKVDKSEQLTFKLRSNPAAADSGLYELTVAYFRTGTPEEWLLLRKAILEVCTGQNLTTGPQRYTVARRILKGDALAAFNDKATDLGNETVGNFDQCLEHVTDHVFPARALQTQKRYMRRMMVKPRDVTIRKYAARLAEINGYLDDFPPHQAGQAIPLDELLEILEFAIPVSWQHQMTRHGIDPSNQTIAQFVQFCERLETTEQTPTDTSNKRPRERDTGDSNGQASKRSRRNGARNNGNDRNKGTGGKYCVKCGTGDHTTNGCWEVRKQLGLPLNDAAKAYFKKKAGSTKKKKTYSDEEINTLVSEKVKAAMKIRDVKPNKDDSADEASVNMEEFNYDPASDSEQE